jgi:hypothetical protein
MQYGGSANRFNFTYTDICWTVTPVLAKFVMVGDYACKFCMEYKHTVANRFSRLPNLYIHAVIETFNVFSEACNVSTVRLVCNRDCNILLSELLRTDMKALYMMQGLRTHRKEEPPPILF